MYVTRPLSHYIKFPDAQSERPEGPNSGYLVLQDEESERYYFFGLFKNRDLRDLPFPQNKNLTVRYSTGAGENNSTSHDDVVFIPVLNQPLSSNRYYAIKPHRSHKGEAYASSREEDMRTCCFCNCIQDTNPRPFNPKDTYQQFEINLYRTGCCDTDGSFVAKSVAPDGFPPRFLRRTGWSVQTKTPKKYHLEYAAGLNAGLRARLPELNSEPIVVGKWYCPFVFIKEGTPKDQVEKSMYYQMTLEQHWEKFFSFENEYEEKKSVSVDAVVKTEVVYVGGREAIWDDRNVDGVIWYRSSEGGGNEISVGLCVEIVERLKWEEERVGWGGGGGGWWRNEGGEGAESGGLWGGVAEEGGGD